MLLMTPRDKGSSVLRGSEPALASALAAVVAAVVAVAALSLPQGALAQERAYYICDQTSITLSQGSFGHFYSHAGYGSTSYSNNIDCSTRFDFPAGYTLWFRVVALSLEPGYDFLRSSERDLSSSSAGAIFSLSRGGSLHFDTDGSVTRSGFDLQFQVRSGTEQPSSWNFFPGSSSYPFTTSAHTTRNNPPTSPVQHTTSDRTTSPSSSSSDDSVSQALDGPFARVYLCGTSYEADALAGVVFSHPAFGRDEYSDNANCEVTVGTDTYYAILVDMFDVETCCDRLTVRTDTGESYTLQNLAERAFLQGPLHITFNTDYSVTRDGFRILFQASSSSSNNWDAVAARANEEENNGGEVFGTFILCGDSQDEHATEGVVFSHSRYGSRDYGNNVDCTVMFGTGLATYAINIDDFSLETCCDHLVVTDGSGSSSTITTERVLTGLSGPITVRFTTDYSVTRSGFRILYQETAISSPSWDEVSARASSAESSLDDDGWTTGAIIGIVAGVMLLLAIVVFCCCICGVCSSKPSTSTHTVTSGRAAAPRFTQANPTTRPPPTTIEMRAIPPPASVRNRPEPLPQYAPTPSQGYMRDQLFSRYTQPARTTAAQQPAPIYSSAPSSPLYLDAPPTYAEATA